MPSLSPAWICTWAASCAPGGATSRSSRAEAKRSCVPQGDCRNSAASRPSLEDFSAGRPSAGVLWVAPAGLALLVAPVLPRLVVRVILAPRGLGAVAVAAPRLLTAWALP